MRMRGVFVLLALRLFDRITAVLSNVETCRTRLKLVEVLRQRRRTACAGVIVIVAVSTSSIARAQPAPGHFEVGGGLHFVDTLRFDGVDANEIGFGGVVRPVFRSRTELESSPGVEARVGVQLTRSLLAEGSIALNRTHLATSITADDEAPNATVTEPVTQFLVQGGLMAYLARWAGGRASPFASAGLGHLRQLHDGQTLVDAGPSYYVGGGMEYLLNVAGARGLRAAGIRADVRGLFLRGRLTLDGGTHVVPVAGAVIFFRF